MEKQDGLAKKESSATIEKAAYPTATITSFNLLTPAPMRCYHQIFSSRLPPQHRGPRRLAWPRTSPFHGGNTGSNPVGDAISNQRLRPNPPFVRGTLAVHSDSPESSAPL